jgi:hypothetical protein
VNVSFGGKNKVMVVTQAGYAPGAWSQHFNFELTGDISEHMEIGGPFSSSWLTYPVSTQGPRSVILADTSVIYSGELIHVTIKVDMTNEGVSSVKVGDTTLAVVKVKLVGTTSLTSPSANESQLTTAYYYYAPSIGYFAKQRQERRGTQGFYCTERTLVSYKLP